MTRVKICGITNFKDAKAASEAGADAIGFVFAKSSPRRVSVAKARAIVKALGPWITTVGVFVNEKPETVRRIVRECGLSAVQLHGGEGPDAARKLTGFKVIQSFPVDGTINFSSVNLYPADAYLFDTRSGGKFGGTGKTFDWKVLRSQRFARPVIVSGGLNPRNVREAVRLVRPYGVDVSSGVERSAGKKDPKLVKEFIANAKEN